MKLVGTDELAAFAARAITTQRLVALVRYVGAGRALTSRGHLKLADAKELVQLLDTGDHVDAVIGGRMHRTRSAEQLPVLDYTFGLARAMWLLDVEGNRVSAGTNAGLIDDPLPLLEMAVLTSLRFLGPTRHRYRHDSYGFGWFADELDRWLAQMLMDLSGCDGGCAVNEVAARAWVGLEEVFDVSHLPEHALRSERWSVERSVRQALDVFVDHGIVTVDGEARAMQPHGFVERTGGVASLTMLGRWMVQRSATR